ncbi:MAG: hypothetical protein JNM07_03765 [Phycisphaerae bacterium]|nr:hypothetical protein [Phycisphaerae bacterium]
MANTRGRVDGRRRRAPRAWLAGLVTAAATVLLGGWAPEPDAVPKRWQLDVKPGGLRHLVVETPDGPRQYLYLTYTVVNNSKQDLLFSPSFDLANGEGDVQRSGRDVPAEVTRTILRHAGNPMAQDQIAISSGTLLQGEENARDGVVIWPVVDVNPAELSVFAAGFSGETATIIPPGAKEKVTLRKTLMLRFAAPGELGGRRDEPIQLAEKRWIMR